MNAQLPELLRANPRNGALVAYLECEQPSAHSDLVEELSRALATGPSHYELFCPDPARFAYVVAFREDGAAFALATGMQAMTLRLAREDRALALADGAEPAPELGVDWLRFALFSGDMAVSRARLARWLARAVQAG